ncbi:ABC transporter permease [Kineococcus sp. SYSU DK003]|uniref:ABC transporter permease n=1 Tax=Kineococcus sp. SYSU DK003 TaxID=3383124 RepID=UPI003D7CE56F
MTTQTPVLAAPTVVPSRAARRGRRLPVPAAAAATVLALVAVMTLLAPLIAPYGPLEGDLAARLQPIGSPGHLLGTDGQGRDVLTRLLYGARPSLLAGLLPVIFAGAVGIVLGLVAALGHPRLHTLVMRALDVLYAFPAVLLAIAIAAALGSGISNAIIALAIILIPPVARVTESEAMRIKSADFMAAAQVSGASRVSIALRQVLPNVAPAVVVYATALVGLSIVYAAGLSYLGLGVSPPTAEWGVMVSEMQQYLFTAPLLLLVPAVAILVVSVAFNVLGDGLRDFFNVRTDAS